MGAKNLCRRCALSGTLACPPGYVCNSVSTSEGIVSCSGFVPKPMVPRRRESPNIQNTPPYRTDSEFIRYLRGALGIGRSKPLSLRERIFLHERDRLREELGSRERIIEFLERERDALRKALLSPTDHERRNNESCPSWIRWP
jgi:hypothetical protein